VLTESTRDRTSAGTWLHYSEILYTLPPQTTNRNNPQHSHSTPQVHFNKTIILILVGKKKILTLLMVNDFFPLLVWVLSYWQDHWPSQRSVFIHTLKMLYVTMQPKPAVTNGVMLYVFFWVIPRRLNFIRRHFQTLCLFQLHRQVGVEWLIWELLGYPYGRRFGSKIAWANSQTFSHMDTPTILKFSHSTPTCLWRWNRQSVLKRWHIKFRRRGITQKKTYNIQNTAKVSNQE
jgi:hypothetical protein